ncbi:hypothetical protein [Sphingomonas sp. KR3-1]|uniref:hypothetical protein n=1 Tax=Sphingomonas sp. KR3-1 TaxID=3156611 RepID=UPI0032B313C9
MSNQAEARAKAFPVQVGGGLLLIAGTLHAGPALAIPVIVLTLGTLSVLLWTRHRAKHD